MRKNWTYEETLLALNLYLKTPYGKIHSRNPQIIELAKILERTPNAVAFKLGNIASLDPALVETGQKGFDHRSKMEEEIWGKYQKNPEDVVYESEKLWRNTASTQEPLSALEEKLDLESVVTGSEKERFVKQRVNQNLFRQRLLAIYNYTCPITKMDDPRLLYASHIIPWSVDAQNRLNPRNGILLNALWDKAFDKGLISFSPDYKVILSPSLKGEARAYFSQYEKLKILFSEKFPPQREFLEYHHQNIFIQ